MAAMEGPLAVFGDRTSGDTIRTQNGTVTAARCWQGLVSRGGRGRKEVTWRGRYRRHVLAHLSSPGEGLALLAASRNPRPLGAGHAAALLLLLRSLPGEARGSPAAGRLGGEAVPRRRPVPGEAPSGRAAAAEPGRARSRPELAGLSRQGLRAGRGTLAGKGRLGKRLLPGTGKSPAAESGDRPRDGRL